jgi:hypothetical protein
MTEYKADRLYFDYTFGFFSGVDQWGKQKGGLNNNPKHLNWKLLENVDIIVFSSFDYV